ncbi:MAG: hypothetical protein PHW01_01070 [Patescibacteria group bacterium]|nr:hypothetical protein [Patescibacteria group bacterium]
MVNFDDEDNDLDPEAGDEDTDDNEDEDEDEDGDAHSFVMALLGGQILDPGNFGRDAVWHQAGLR